MPRYGMTYNIKGGGSYHVSGSKPFPKPCYVCGCMGGSLCDYVLTFSLENETCDRPMCEDHRHHVEPNTDYCEEHRTDNKEGEKT